MNRSERLAVTVVGYIAIEILSLATSIVASFITWGSLLYRPDGTSPGDGIGFLAVLSISFTASLLVAVVAPLAVQGAIPRPEAWPLRVAISFLAPIAAAIVMSALITLLLELSTRLAVIRLFV